MQDVLAEKNLSGVFSICKDYKANGGKRSFFCQQQVIVMLGIAAEITRHSPIRTGF